MHHHHMDHHHRSHRMQMRADADVNLAARNAKPLAEPTMAVHVPRQADTVVSVVYVTMPKTFTGKATYVTVKPGKTDSPNDPGAGSNGDTKTAAQDTKVANTEPAKATTRPTQAASPANTKDSSSENTSADHKSSTKDSASKTASADSKTSKSTATGSSSNSAGIASTTTSIAGKAAASAAAASSAISSGTASSSQGMSGGAKAGLALGILVVIGLLLAGVLLFYRKKKQDRNAAHQRLDDEKAELNAPDMAAAPGMAPSISINDRAGSVRTARTLSTAPRLSLRPVTEFHLNLEQRKSQGNLLATTAATPASHTDSRGMLAPAPQAGGSAWERTPSTEKNDNSNPFGDRAEISPSSSQRASPEPGKEATGGFGLAPPAAFKQVKTDSMNIFSGQIPAFRDSTASAASSQAPAPAPAPAPAQKTLEAHKNVPAPLSLKSNAPSIAPSAPSPAYTDFTDFTQANEVPASPGPAPSGPTPAAPGMAAAAIPGSPRGPAPNNVHRVQMDFKPSMEDELELRAGQLVRMLHEYDDGWALCLRMDRSQQGVVPRTCLSKHPVKPRPANGPPGSPGPRGPPRSISPALRGPPVGPDAQRFPSPPSGRNSPGPFANPPRPLSPASGRGSPGPYGQRPMSPANNGGRARSHSNDPRGPPRSMSPGPYAGYQRPPPPNTRRRSNSASQVMARRASPPGPSPMNPNAGLAPMRKPVPGQAL